MKNNCVHIYKIINTLYHYASETGNQSCDINIQIYIYRKYISIYHAGWFTEVRA